MNSAVQFIQSCISPEETSQLHHQFESVAYRQGVVEGKESIRIVN
jgi:hypothetical protein